MTLEKLLNKPLYFTAFGSECIKSKFSCLRDLLDPGLNLYRPIHTTDPEVIAMLEGYALVHGVQITIEPVLRKNVYIIEEI